MKAIGYVRVSTSSQADRGVSLEAQTEKIRAMAVVHGVELADVIVDAGESAKTLARPGMARLLDMVNSRTVDMVVIAKLDRLTRSVKDLGELLEKFTRRGVSLISVAESLDTGSAAGRLVLNIMVSVSQWEREAISERTSDALRHKKTRGERCGNIRYGSRLSGDGVHLEQEPRELEIIARVQTLRKVGISAQIIAANLNREGFRTRRGGEWTREYVASISRTAL